MAKWLVECSVRMRGWMYVQADDEQEAMTLTEETILDDATDFAEGCETVDVSILEVKRP